MKNESKFFATYIHQIKHNYFNEYIYIYIYTHTHTHTHNLVHIIHITKSK